MAVGRGGRSLMGPFLVINLVVYLIVLGLAGWSLDKYIDGEQNHPRASSMLPGFVHLHKWTSQSLATAASSAIISWIMTALAFGLVCKQIIMGGHRGKRLQTLEALITIAMVSQLLYILLLHAGICRSSYGPVYGSYGPQH
ncbi:membrane protein PM19L isoform X2 [Capsicum annuum]|uniref:membrane protein PM19L isoform X2 n=1 Tax=Capsicum annuum TaxID=4072 RepID=UPI0007BF06F2|nr:membrane protein PM19L isoform X2 [Capsicum annuum]